MEPKELIEKLSSVAAAIELATAIGNPGIQVAKGWNLTQWTVRSVRGCIAFGYLNEDQKTVKEVVAVVNAPEEKRKEYTPIKTEQPTTILMLG